MIKLDKNFILLILMHLFIGALIFFVPILASVYSFLILLIGSYYVIRNQNSGHEVLFVSAYIVGSEVFLRMTGGNPNHEFAKYSIIVFSILGMYFNGFSKYSFPYWFFLLLLIPGVFVASNVINLSSDVRKTMMFNISGSLCIGIASIYTYDKEISFKQINRLLLMLALPIFSCAVYLFFYTPDLNEALDGTGSNFVTSGGFGPNQVSTALGLGTFIFFTRILLDSKNIIDIFLNVALAVFIAFRGLLTFSRGGMITGFISVIILIFVIYYFSKNKGRYKMIYLTSFLIILSLSLWTYSSIRTNGLIDKRYANQDAAGRVKKDKFTGREKLADKEMEMFISNPFLGVGLGKASEIRLEESGKSDKEGKTASHSEITRMLAEHGSLGMLCLIILFITPIAHWQHNKQNVYMFSFLFFWLLTINHAAMRTAAPAFVYALSVLKVRIDE